MTRDGQRDLPKGITPKLRKHGTRSMPVATADGTPVYRVRMWDPVLKRQIERTAERPGCGEAAAGRLQRGQAST